jgi:glutathione peroxidase-family protein
MERLLSAVRERVSGDKYRYHEGATNLDLTYITERIIAMSFPAEGFESSYRNDINEVARFLKEKHPSQFMVFNLCSERGYNYGLLDNNVQVSLVFDCSCLC